MQKRTDILEPTDLDMGLDHEMEEQGPVAKLIRAFRKGPILLAQAIDATRMANRPADRGPSRLAPEGFVHARTEEFPLTGQEILAKLRQ